MTQDPARFRPKTYPAPEFPPRKPALFARTPPAIFPPILGLIGLGLLLRKVAGGAEPLAGVAELGLGLVAALWVLAIVALKAKALRRLSVLAEDMRPLPGRAGLAAATVSGMLMAAVLVPYAPGVALVLAFAALLAHAILAGILIATLRALPPEAREVNPGWHLSFVGFIVAAVPLAALGYLSTATAILYGTATIALAIWAVSAAQLLRRIPPAPLRPMLAIHLAPAALICTVATATGHPLLAQAAAALGAVILLALVGAGRWVLAAGFSPMWGALTFPLAAYATALTGLGGAWTLAGQALAVAATLAIPPIAWNILKLWPGGRLAEKTNAAEA